MQQKTVAKCVLQNNFAALALLALTVSHMPAACVHMADYARVRVCHGERASWPLVQMKGCTRTAGAGAAPRVVNFRAPSAARAAAHAHGQTAMAACCGAFSAARLNTTATQTQRTAYRRQRKMD